MTFKKLKIPEEKFQQIRDLYVNGVPCSDIEFMTGINHENIRRWMKERGITRAVQLRKRPVKPCPITKKGKYDYLIAEPTNQGKDYKAYVREGR